MSRHRSSGARVVLLEWLALGIITLAIADVALSLWLALS